MSLRAETYLHPDPAPKGTAREFPSNFTRRLSGRLRGNSFRGRSCSGVRFSRVGKATSFLVYFCFSSIAISQGPFLGFAITESSQPWRIEGEGIHQTRLGRRIKPVGMRKRFLESGFHQCDSSDDGAWIKPYYYEDVDMIEKFSEENFYSESYFNDVVERP